MPEHIQKAEENMKMMITMTTKMRKEKAEDDVLTLEFIIVRVYHAQVLLRHSTRGLVLVHTQDGF
jgi:hypothetical protein